MGSLLAVTHASIACTVKLNNCKSDPTLPFAWPLAEYIAQTSKERIKDIYCLSSTTIEQMACGKSGTTVCAMGQPISTQTNCLHVPVNGERKGSGQASSKAAAQEAAARETLQMLNLL